MSVFSTELGKHLYSGLHAFCSVLIFCTLGVCHVSEDLGQLSFMNWKESSVATR